MGFLNGRGCLGISPTYWASIAGWSLFGAATGGTLVVIRQLLRA